MYQVVLPLINSGTCALLDDRMIEHQFVGLERRVSRNGKDSIDHGPAGRDDVANAIAGVLAKVQREPSFALDRGPIVYPKSWEKAYA